MELITIDDTLVRTDAQGRYCLNDLHKAAIANGKATENHAPAQFLRNDGVQAFICALDAEMGDVQKSTSVHSVKGGKSQGTYAVELVAIRYAAWINPAFEVRVYRTFQKATKGETDWRKLRHQSASSFKVANEILRQVREAGGKDTETHHYSNEARLINWSLTGEFKSVDRDSLPTDQLDLLAHLQARNAVLIGRGLSYDQRKPIVKQYAMDWRMAHTAQITHSGAI